MGYFLHAESFQAAYKLTFGCIVIHCTRIVDDYCFLFLRRSLRLIHEGCPISSEEPNCISKKELAMYETSACGYLPIRAIIFIKYHYVWL